jgi:uncharacterized protein YndB with AHSA1/START domain
MQSRGYFGFYQYCHMKKSSTPALLLLVAIYVIATTITFGQAGERAISLSIDISAPIDSVWSRFSSAAGIRKFFAPSCVWELTTLGKAEILFAPQAPAGQRGAENNVIMAFQPNEMISLSWDAPPIFPEIRKQRTYVIFRFQKAGERKTTVLFTHTGFGSGTDWDAVYNYFIPAWSSVVLPRLKYSCEVGPIDWANPPEDLAAAQRR